ncbi:MAG TPA: hypothetical protein VFQ65_11075 [Kofleriaceae bacterium]|nr:hypothetical protein [Kofleriaceae bacterium]
MTSRAVLVLLAACSDPAARVSLVSIDFGNPCGRPDTTKTPVSEVRVTAYGPTGDTRRIDGVIDDFPASTEQLGVEVFGGAVVLSAGNTAPLAYNDLANQTTIPIAMVPLDGFCPLRDMTAPRVRPLVAHAGAGVLIVGGNVAPIASQIVPSAEYYDPATATFTQIPLPMALAETATSLLGASIAELGDGRVVVWSGAALTVFDPTKMAFTNPVFVEARNEQAMFGLDATHLLVTGGCQYGSTLDCAGDATVRRSTLEYELDAQGALVGNGVAKPALPASSVRFGGTLFDIGVTADGKRRLTLAGAVSDPSSADQIPFSEPDDDGIVTVAQHLFSQVSQLDGGALLTAFDPDGTAMPGDAASIVPAEGGDGIDVARAPKITGARLITLEDGTAVAIGGDAGISRYEPTTNTWMPLAPAADQVASWPGAITAPSLIRLADGTVLVLGGGTAATPTASAWLYRPSLVGPRIGTVTAFANASGAVLTPTSPATVTHGPNQLTLTAPDDNLTARVLVGGPRLAVGTLDASLANVTAGVALIAQQTGPSRALAARLVIGEAAQIVRYSGSTRTTLCSGATVTAGDFTALHLVVTGDSVTVAAGMVTKVSCDFTKDPIAPEAGAWGIAAIANGSLDVVTVAVSR